MSYFDTIYADERLPHRAKAVYMYLRDRCGRKKTAGRAFGPLQLICMYLGALSSER